MKQPYHTQTVLVGLLFFWLCALSVRANVYATDIHINGSLQAGILLPSGSVTISYILNQPATRGVVVQVYSGATVIKTFTFASGDPGAMAGLNSVVWDGTTDNESTLAQGVYTVIITASATGYADWTPITDDGPNFSVAVPRGISVNQNTNSPYYGRVFVANTYTQYGIFKYNADGSPSDEGGFSAGGVMWGPANQKFSPWKMAISPDDKVYIDDFSGDGLVYEFDQTISANCRHEAVRSDNYPEENPQLSGLAVTGTGSGTQIWMSDYASGDSAGIVRWQAAVNGVAATGDMGTVIAPINPDFLSQAPFDLALDTNGYLYTIQCLTTETPAYALMRFLPYAGEQETTPDWAIDMYPTLLAAYGVAVDPTAANVAVAVVGEGDPETHPTGGLYVYSATNGDFVTQVNQTDGGAYYDVAWDNVGNLYALDGVVGVWRAYSPPGANQATTVAVPVIQFYNALLPPALDNPALDMDSLHFTLAGQSNVTYVVQRSCDLLNWTDAVTNFSTNKNRCICVPFNGNQDFYRAVTTAP